MQTFKLDSAVRKVAQTVGRAAATTTTAAGAVGGAAVNGVIGGVTGTVAGVQRGAGAGSRSMPAAALTLGAIGISGLAEWPLVVAVGGGALLLRQLNRPDKPVTAPAKSPRSKPRRSSPAKATTRR